MGRKEKTRSGEAEERRTKNEERERERRVRETSETSETEPLVNMTTTLARMPLCQNKAAGTTNALVHSSRRRLARNVTVRATPNKDAKVATTEGVVGRRGGVLLGLVGGLTAVARPAQAGLFGGIPEEVYVEDAVSLFFSHLLHNSPQLFGRCCCPEQTYANTTTAFFRSLIRRKPLH